MLPELGSELTQKQAWIEFNDVLFGGLSYGTLQSHCTRSSVPKLNYRLLPNYCLYNYVQKQGW